MNYEFHEYANLFPLMSDEEHSALVEDMSKNGYDERYPVMIYHKQILDGRNRFLAAQEAGVEPRFAEFYTAFDDEALDYVIRSNLHRRHLTPGQRAVVAARMANMRHGGDRKSDQAANLRLDISQAEAAKTMGVSERSVNEVKAIEQIAPELIKEIENGFYTINEAKKQAKIQTKLAEKKELVKQFAEAKNTDICVVQVGDIQTFETDMTFDAIITDPPYPKEYLPLWSDLARFAKSHLKHGGVLLAMSGQYWLPEVMRRLGEYLDYQWIMSCDFGGQKNSNYGAKVINIAWKPVLVYRNGGEPVKISIDRFTNDKPDKNFHIWGQGVNGYLWQVEQFTKPNDLICDPFLGGGTTAVASVQSSRRFFGFDIDPENVAITKARLNGISNT